MGKRNICLNDYFDIFDYPNNEAMVAKIAEFWGFEYFNINEKEWGLHYPNNSDYFIILYFTTAVSSNTTTNATIGLAYPTSNGVKGSTVFQSVSLGKNTRLYAVAVETANNLAFGFADSDVSNGLLYAGICTLFTTLENISEGTIERKYLGLHATNYKLVKDNDLNIVSPTILNTTGLSVFNSGYIALHPLTIGEVNSIAKDVYFTSVSPTKNNESRFIEVNNKKFFALMRNSYNNAQCTIELDEEGENEG